MHEAGIAQNILEIAIETAQTGGATEIEKVHMQIGRLAGIDPESLRFSFDALKEETIAQNAELVIEVIPVTGRCEDCGHEAEYDSMFFQCKGCESWKVRIITGEELRVTSIDVP